MLPVERQSLILSHLADSESVRTIELATILEVTDETVRKDLENLEQRGELLRIHGGAVRPNQSRVELALAERKQVNREAKTADPVSATCGFILVAAKSDHTTCFLPRQLARRGAGKCNGFRRIDKLDVGFNFGVVHHDAHLPTMGTDHFPVNG